MTSGGEPRLGGQPRPLWWRITIGGLLAGAALAAVTARVIVAGEAELGASTAALRAGDPVEATVRARRAAAWYAPGAPHIRVAYERLMAIGKEAEARHRPDVALLAFEGVHEAAVATRWLVTPHADDLAAAAAAIARIRSRDLRPPEATTTPDAQIERELLEALATRPGPSRPTSAALGIAFVAMLGGLGWVVARAVDATGRLALPRARLGFAIAGAGLVAWVVLLLLA